MKLGIYGDSYAESGDVNLKNNWINIFKQLLENDIDKKVFIDHHAYGGSSLYYSYKKFKETGHNYDLVIFLATEPHRYTEPVDISGSKRAITCKAQLELILSSEDIDEKTKKMIINLLGWFDSNDEQYNNEMSDLMIDKIECSHKNIIIYPCFVNSFTLDRFCKYGLDPFLHPCHSFWYKQLEILHIEYRDFTAREKLTLFGHLVPEFNKYFAEVLFTKYKTGKFNLPSYDNITIEHPKEHYYYNWD